MKQYFKVSAKHMAYSGIDHAVIFPVKDVETNMVGGKGFDAFITLDAGDGWIEGQYVGRDYLVAVARGEFVTQEDYDLQQAKIEADKLEAKYAEMVAMEDADLLKRKQEFVKEYWHYNAVHSRSTPFPKEFVDSTVEGLDAAGLDVEIDAAKQAVESGDEVLEAMLAKHGIIGPEA